MEEPSITFHSRSQDCYRYQCPVVSAAALAKMYQYWIKCCRFGWPSTGGWQIPPYPPASDACAQDTTFFACRCFSWPVVCACVKLVYSMCSKWSTVLNLLQLASSMHWPRVWMLEHSLSRRRVQSLIPDNPCRPTFFLQLSSLTLCDRSLSCNSG